MAPDDFQDVPFDVSIHRLRVCSPSLLTSVMHGCRSRLRSVRGWNEISCRSSRCYSSLRSRYGKTCATTGTGIFVLAALAMVNAVGFSPLFYFITSPFATGYEEGYYAGYGCFAVELLMFPVAGLVGEICCKRFRILVFGAVLISVGAVAYSVIFGLWKEIKNYSGLFSTLLFTPFLLVVPGVGIFQANALQYGVDQLDFPPSEVISSFVYWYYWTSYVFISPIVALSFFRVIVYHATLLCVSGALLALLLCLTLYCCHRNPHLRADPGGKHNPLKLTWSVTQYVKGERVPAFRSAFTYNEMPSRLDLAKRRYGGPFTTEEVENVKSFWRILLVLGSLIGFQLQDDTLLTMTGAVFLAQEFCTYYLTSTWTITSLVIAVGVPAYQFCVRPCFSRHVPRMLTRMGIGLVITFVSLAITTTYAKMLSSTSVEIYTNTSETDCNATGCRVNASFAFVCHQLKDFNNAFFENATFSCVAGSSTSFNTLPSLYWLVIPQTLNGLAHMLVFLTALEFILAQAPRTMQGFLIGLWYAMQVINVGVSITGYLSCAAFHWQYYATKTLLVFLSLFLFATVATRYKYRQLNEDADVNVRQQVEEVFERNMEREAAYIQQKLLSEQASTLEDDDLPLQQA